MIILKIDHFQMYSLFFDLFINLEKMSIKKDSMALRWCILHGLTTANSAILLRIIITFVLHSTYFTEITFKNRYLFFEFLQFFEYIPYFGAYMTLALTYKTEIVTLTDIMKQIIDEINYGKNLMGIRVTAEKTDIDELKQMQNLSMEKLHVTFEFKIFR